MDVTREDLAAAKLYMRVDGDEDDLVVSMCLTAARAYMTDAGVSLPEAGTTRRALYDIVCHAQALSLYDRRDPTIVGGSVNDNPVLRRLLTQLKQTEPVSKSDTGGEG